MATGDSFAISGPRGADQPAVPVPGEGAVQVAAPEDPGAVRGFDAGRHLEGTRRRRDKGDRSLGADRAGRDRRRDPETTSGCLKVRWRSARSVTNTPA